MIVGIDEVGRGPWAGPLVMGAVVLGCEIDGLTDSKKLTKKRREELNEIILGKAAAVGIGWVSAEELDEMGMSAALTQCCLRALRQIKVPFHEIIIDGTINFLQGSTLQDYVTTMKKADLLVPSVSAASIVAKVARDNFMAEQDAKFPGYNFKGHVGYGTVTHKSAIETNGATPLHRLSFAPLAAYRTVTTEQHDGKVGQKHTTRSIGDASEEVAAQELARRGHEILDRNWKTKYCEIDIISKKNDTYYFTEVKHRKNSRSGDGLAAITPKKLNQMRYAARFYAHVNRTGTSNLQLLAVATTGKPPHMESLVEVY
jgi:ribonuclease HII